MILVTDDRSIVAFLIEIIPWNKLNIVKGVRSAILFELKIHFFYWTIDSWMSMIQEIAPKTIPLFNQATHVADWNLDIVIALSLSRITVLVYNLNLFIGKNKSWFIAFEFIIVGEISQTKRFALISRSTSKVPLIEYLFNPILVRVPFKRDGFFSSPGHFPRLPTIISICRPLLRWIKMFGTKIQMKITKNAFVK